MPAPRCETQKSFGLICDGLPSVKNSLATSHCQILPLKWVTSSVTCLCSRSLSSALLIVPPLTPVVSHVGNWLCQASVCPRTNWSCCWANVTRRSPPDQSYVPRVGSTTCHFISLPGVTVENWSPVICRYASLSSSNGVTAVPNR